MLVFSNEKLVFLSVPKTGTTAYEAALAPRAAWVGSGESNDALDARREIHRSCPLANESGRS